MCKEHLNQKWWRRSGQKAQLHNTAQTLRDCTAVHWFLDTTCWCVLHVTIMCDVDEPLMLAFGILHEVPCRSRTKCTCILQVWSIHLGN